MKYFSILALILTTSAMANESGYMWQGKKYVVYQDGVKKMDPPERKERSPAGFMNNGSFGETIMYEVDTSNGVVCYWKKDAPDNVPISCVKK